MKVLVVFESLWGNTEKIARAIGNGMTGRAEVTVVDVEQADAALTDDVDLIVVGGPTHAWGMSRPMTRHPNPAKSGRAPQPRTLGVREWLDALPAGEHAAAAAFDTRIDKPRWMTGSAARGIRRGLSRHGYSVIAPPVSFRVADMDGPLVEGELERASAWGRDLVERAVKAA